MMTSSGKGSAPIHIKFSGPDIISWDRVNAVNTLKYLCRVLLWLKHKQQHKKRKLHLGEAQQYIGDRANDTRWTQCMPAMSINLDIMVQKN